MPKICYTKRDFSGASLATIERANQILEDYAAQGYDLTLRQLYYQFVSRSIIPNKDAEYKKLGSIVNDARLSGLIDWGHITDRTRNVRQNSHWSSPRDIIKTCSTQYLIDKWAGQANYVEVWVEKDALIGVLEVACAPLDVSYFSCRGYTSQSEMWVAGQRILGEIRKGKKVTIIHLGDHDPSGVDMSRDIRERISGFLDHHMTEDFLLKHKALKSESKNVEAYKARILPLMRENRKEWDNMLWFSLNRVALNMDQIRQYSPPPNPAKLTDSRSSKYVDKYGDESWELDALEPSVITELIQGSVEDLRNDDIWTSASVMEAEDRRKLAVCAERWDKLSARF